MADKLLVGSNLHKTYFRKSRTSAHDFNAVDGVDIVLSAGKLVVLMGRSGSGKSTLLSMLAGILEPTEGTVALSGTNLYALDDTERSRFRNQHIGVVPQGQTAIMSLNVLDNVLLPYSMYHKNLSAEAEKRAWGLLENMGIAELSEVFPSELSGGEMRRMAIARALMCEPEVLLADEPTGDLDDENTEIVLSLMKQAATDGCGVLLVTHEQEAQKFADTVLKMDAGKISHSQQ